MMVEIWYKSDFEEGQMYSRECIDESDIFEWIKYLVHSSWLCQWLSGKNYLSFYTELKLVLRYNNKEEDLYEFYCKYNECDNEESKALKLLIFPVSITPNFLKRFKNG
jgi:hypothetical protein